MGLKHIFQTTLTDVKTRDKEGVGRERLESNGHRYRWVQCAEAAATDFVAGQVAFHKISDGEDMLKKVYVALTANLSVMAGVVMGALEGGGTDVATNTEPSFGWVQTFGYNTSVSVSGATTGGTDIAAGDYLKGITAVKHVIRDAATQSLYRRNIQILEALGTTTTPAAGFKKAFVNCL